MTGRRPRGERMLQDHLPLLTRLAARGEPFAIATVIEIRGSASARPGSKAVIDRKGKVLSGWVGGGCAQSTVCGTAVECQRDGQTRIVDLNLDDEVLGTGMPCGGSMRVYVEPILPKQKLWILGHGRIAECLCSLGALLGFDVIVDDPMAERDFYPAAARLLAEDLDYGQLTPEAEDCAVVATQHKGDHQSILRLLESPVGSIALIASRKRSGLVLDYLREKGVAEDQIARVRAPAGLDIGAATPEEIALSVMSEIVMLRRQGSGKAMRLRTPARIAELAG
ncbi:MAG: XdhC family protein [Acetobacteraceae bacterium]